jgi:hypothetical protein
MKKNQTLGERNIVAAIGATEAARTTIGRRHVRRDSAARRMAVVTKPAKFTPAVSRLK